MRPSDDRDPPPQHFAVLLAPHHDVARRMARRLSRSNAEGDDLFHDAAVHAMSKLNELRDESRFRPWFFAIILSAHRARHRRSFWQRFLPFEEGAPPTVTSAHSTEEAERMARALASLPPDGREAFVLFELEGFSIEEIAAMQRASVPAVKSRLTRARARLVQFYERLERLQRLESDRAAHRSPKSRTSFGETP